MGFLTAHKGGWLLWTVPSGSATFAAINVKVHQYFHIEGNFLFERNIDKMKEIGRK